MTTFSILYAKHGPDVELIAKKLRIKPSSVDRLINKAMDEKYAAAKKVAERLAYERAYRENNKEAIAAARKRQNARIRSQLREIREAHAR